MPQKNSWSSSSSSGRAVEEVDNLTVAASVIRSLRASAAQQRYQLFAFREGQALVQSVEQLDTIIAAEKERAAAQQVKQRAVDDALIHYLPSPFASPDSKAENSSQARPQKNDVLSDDDEDSEEESTHRLAWQEEEEQEEQQQESKQRDPDDDILMEDEDTEDLLTGFVAPTNALTMGMKSTSKPLPSISGSSSSLPLPVAPRKLNPIRPVDVASSAIKKGVIIKPGQAIRVKPASRLKKN